MGNREGERERESQVLLLSLQFITERRRRRSFLPGLPPRVAYVLLCVRVADAAADVADYDDDNSNNNSNNAGDDVAAH